MMPNWTSNIVAPIARVFSRGAHAVKAAAERGITLIDRTLVNIKWLLETSWSSLAKEAYGKNAVAYSAVRLLSQSIPEAPLVGYTGDEDNRTALPPTHPLMQRIAHPNELMTEFEFWELTTIHMAVVGRSVWWKERANGGQVLNLWPLRPDRVGPAYSISKKEGERVLEGWHYQAPGEGLPVLLPRRDCVAFNFPDPDGDSGGIVEGLGPLSVLSREISADNLATAHVGALMANHAQPTIALRVKKAIRTEAEATLAKAKFKFEFGGKNLGQPAVIDDDTEIEKLGFSLKDLEFPGLRQNAEARICAALGVPPIMIGVTAGLDASTYSNYAQARQVFTETTLSMYWRRYADQVTNDLAIEYGDDITCEFDTSNVKALAGQFAEKLMPFKEAFAIGALTLNQYISKLGLDPFPPDVGDVLYVPNSVTIIPATEEARAIIDKRKEENMARFQEQQEENQQSGEEANGQEGEQGEQEAGQEGQAVEGQQGEQIEGKSVKAAMRDPRVDAEMRLQRSLVELFGKLMPDLAKRIRNGETIPQQELADAFARVIQPQLIEVATNEGMRIAAEIGVGMDPASVNAQAAAWARQYTFEMVRGLTDATMKVLQNAVSTYNTTPGMTLAEVENLISAAFGEARATVIAQTEITRAYSQSMNQYKDELSQQGVKVERIWQSVNDSIVCMICAPLDGQPEDKWKDRFPGGPPAHPSCRCALTIRNVP